MWTTFSRISGGDIVVETSKANRAGFEEFLGRYAGEGRASPALEDAARKGRPSRREPLRASRASRCARPGSEPRRPSWVQHAGRANRPPDADAVAGLDTLLAAIGEGRVRCASPDPGARRQEPETIDPVRAFEAWRPFMPKRMAREGLEGLRRTVGNLP
jgi:hypothetical protein